MTIRDEIRSVGRTPNAAKTLRQVRILRSVYKLTLTETVRFYVVASGLCASFWLQRVTVAYFLSLFTEKTLES